MPHQRTNQAARSMVDDIRDAADDMSPYERSMYDQMQSQWGRGLAEVGLHPRDPVVAMAALWTARAIAHHASDLAEAGHIGVEAHAHAQLAAADASVVALSLHDAARQSPAAMDPRRRSGVAAIAVLLSALLLAGVIVASRRDQPSPAVATGDTSTSPALVLTTPPPAPVASHASEPAASQIDAVPPPAPDIVPIEGADPGPTGPPALTPADVRPSPRAAQLTPQPATHLLCVLNLCVG